MIRRWTKFMEKIIGGQEPVLRLYESYYRELVARELDLAAIDAGDKILCIGGGAVPCTAMELARRTRADIRVVDIDQLAVRRAGQLVARAGLEDRIKVCLADGGSMNVDQYDVIHIALQVCPKEGVVRNILGGCKAGCRVIIRQPRSYLACFYSQLSRGLLEEYNLEEARTRIKSLSATDQILVLTKPRPC